MNEVLVKLKSVIAALEKEHGPILIFALFLREDPLEKWDIVVSASWLSPIEKSAYNIIASKIQNTLTSTELVQFSRIVILDRYDPAVSFLQNTRSITNGGFQESPKDFSVDIISDRFGFTIKKAYLLRCQTI